MKRPKTIGFAITLALVSAAIWGWGHDSATDVRYRFVTVQKGDVHSVVSATGSLEAVTTVQVGTQVSGTIADLRADFNDEVREGTIRRPLADATNQDLQIALDRSRKARPSPVIQFDT